MLECQVTAVRRRSYVRERFGIRIFNCQIGLGKRLGLRVFDVN